jgi:hypothetical protein
MADGNALTCAQEIWFALGMNSFVPSFYYRSQREEEYYGKYW